MTAEEHRARIAAAFAKAHTAQTLADDAQQAAEYAWEDYAAKQEQAADEAEHPMAILDAQIDALAHEARDAGDFVMRVICDIALHGRVDDNGVDVLAYETHELRTALDGMDQDAARAECSRMIRAAADAHLQFRDAY